MCNCIIFFKLNKFCGQEKVVNFFVLSNLKFMGIFVFKQKKCMLISCFLCVIILIWKFLRLLQRWWKRLKFTIQYISLLIYDLLKYPSTIYIFQFILWSTQLFTLYLSYQMLKQYLLRMIKKEKIKGSYKQKKSFVE